MKTVFHLNSPDNSKKSELLGNLENLREDERVEIEDIKAVLNSGAVEMALKGSKAEKYVKECRENGVEFLVCRNSLENTDKTKEDVIDGLKIIESGVGSLNLLIEKGYNYIKV